MKKKKMSSMNSLLYLTIFILSQFRALIAKWVWFLTIVILLTISFFKLVGANVQSYIGVWQKIKYSNFICCSLFAILKNYGLHWFYIMCDALLSSLLDPLEGLGVLNCGKLELEAALDFQH